MSMTQSVTFCVRHSRASGNPVSCIERGWVRAFAATTDSRFGPRRSLAQGQREAS